MKSEDKTVKSSLTRKVLVLFAVIALMESGFLLLLSGLLDDAEKRLQEERFARAAVSSITRFSALHHHSVAVLIRQTEHKRMLNADYKKLFSLLPAQLEELKTIFKDRPDDLARIKELDDSVNEALELVDKTVESRLTKDSDQKKMMHAHYAIQLMDASERISKRVDEIAARYKGIQHSASQSAASTSDSLLFVSLVFGFSVNAGIAIALYLYVVRGITERLTVVSANTVNIAEGKSLLAPVKGNDEVARLDSTFRQMAGNLEAFRTKEKTILENAANFICLLDRQGNFVSIPAACVAMWGFSADHLQGKSLPTLVEPQFATSTSDALGRLLESGDSTSFENQIRCPDGTVQELAWTAKLNDDGNIICIAHDITERKRIVTQIDDNRKRFSTIIEFMPIAMVNCDHEYAIQSINAATTSMFLYEAPELAGKSLNVLLTNPSSNGKSLSNQSSKEIVEAIDLARKQIAQLSAWRKNGTQIPVELRLNTYNDSDGERLLACFRDISARVELELAKRDFVSMIGHDLRSPLLSLYGTIGMLSADKQTAVWAEAESIVEGLVALINDFLDLGKVESAPETLLLNEASLVQLVENVFKECSTIDFGSSDQLSQKPPIVLHCSDNYAPKVHVDEARFHRALICFTGAFCFYNSWQKQITIEVLSKNDETAMIRIGGAGCRLPQLVKETCIEGYAFVDTGTYPNSSGIRLALSRAIVQAHRGSISIAMAGTNEFLEVSIPVAGTRTDSPGR